MNKINESSFLGTGWTFPPSFDLKEKKIVMVSNEEDITQSLHILLHTIPGERIMEPEYGCDLRKLVFEKLDNSLIHRFNEIISSAILNFEPRIKFQNIEVLEKNNQEGRIMIKVNYTIITTNTRHNIVFPFYLYEGTNVPDKI